MLGQPGRTAFQIFDAVVRARSKPCVPLSDMERLEELGHLVSAPTIYSPQEIADLLGVSRETVLRKCREGKWPHLRLTRQTIVFTHEDLAALLEASRAGTLGGARQP